MKGGCPQHSKETEPKKNHLPIFVITMPHIVQTFTVCKTITTGSPSKEVPGKGRSISVLQARKWSLRFIFIWRLPFQDLSLFVYAYFQHPHDEGQGRDSYSWCVD